MDTEKVDQKDPKGPTAIWSMRHTPKREPSIGTIARDFPFPENEPLPHSGSEFISLKQVESIKKFE